MFNLPLNQNYNKSFRKISPFFKENSSMSKKTNTLTKKEQWGWVYSTTSSVEEAQKISKFLVTKKLVACANIIPNIISYYTDENQIQSHNETALILKTKQSLFYEIQKEMKNIHSYKCPCLIFIPFSQISSSFSQWINEKTKKTI